MSLVSNLLPIFSSRDQKYLIFPAIRISTKILVDNKTKLEVSGKHTFYEAGPGNY